MHIESGKTAVYQAWQWPMDVVLQTNACANEALHSCGS